MKLFNSFLKAAGTVLLFVLCGFIITGIAIFAAHYFEAFIGLLGAVIFVGLWYDAYTDEGK